MNKADLEKLAADRIADAKALLDAGRWSGAYYLAGYAVECALKACVAKLVQAGDFPDKKLAENSWSHDIKKLIDAAGLKISQEADAKQNPILSSNWNLPFNWTERSRYEQIDEMQARALYFAITDTTNGVLPWIRSHW